MVKLTFRRKKSALPTLPPPPPAAAATSKPASKKKAVGTRLWMWMDRLAHSELIDCDKTLIINRLSLPARDFRILGPIFSHSSTILAREKAMIVNLEFIKAIVTAEEVLLLDPLRQEVLPFVDQLRRQLPQKIPSTNEIQDELPFEFQVLEMVLKAVCSYLDSSVAELERDAYPALDQLVVSVSTKNLEHVRSLKSNLTRLLGRVQKVRDEIEHLLDDNEDMAQLYLTRKLMYSLQAAESLGPAAPHLPRLNSARSGSFVGNHLIDHDVVELEMLLEAYFMQLDGTRNKIISVREYIDDTEDYVNIQLDHQRNELIQLQLKLTSASFAVAVETGLAGMFGMNIPCTLYTINGIFWPIVGLMTGVCLLLFLLILGYARWKKLLGS